MGNTTNANWDEGSPAITDPRRDGAQEIRVLRGALRTRLLKEHIEPAAVGVGGEHLEGSARSYRASGAPTLKPDGVTLLDTNDKGRLWVDSDNNQIYNWSGTAWVLIGDLPITLVDYASWSKGTTSVAGGAYRDISNGCLQVQASTGGWDTSVANGVRITTGTYLFEVEFNVGSGGAVLSGAKVTFSGTATPSSFLELLDGTSQPAGASYHIRGRVVITAAYADFEFLAKTSVAVGPNIIIAASRYHFEKIA